MKRYLYFLSYARADRDTDDHNTIRLFHKRLAEDIRLLTGRQLDDVGFFDGADIEPGDFWPDRLGEGLGGCGVFISMYSPTYFTQEYCGKEWQVFSRRLRDYVLNVVPARSHPPLILPVLLVPPLYLPARPESVSDIQYDYDDFPRIYRQEGLVVLTRMDKYKDEYEEFIRVFARKVVSVSQMCQLPPLAPLPDIKRVQSAFHKPGRAEIAYAQAELSMGPRYAQFFMVAGQQQEMVVVRQDVDCYGSTGGGDWQPFAPDEPRDIAAICQEVAQHVGLFYEPITVDERTPERIREAKAANKVTVIIADAWSLELPHYQQLMLRLDEEDLSNCAIIVISDVQDQGVKARLERAVRAAVPRFANPDGSNPAVSWAGSLEEARVQLSHALDDLRRRAIDHSVTVTQAQGPRPIGKPSIAGPGKA